MIIQPDPLAECRTASGLYTPVETRIQDRGIVMLHEESTAWGEDPVIGRRVLYDRKAIRRITIAEIEFFVLPESAVLGVFEEQEV